MKKKRREAAYLGSCSSSFRRATSHRPAPTKADKHYLHLQLNYFIRTLSNGFFFFFFFVLLLSFFFFFAAWNRTASLTITMSRKVGVADAHAALEDESLALDNLEDELEADDLVSVHAVAAFSLPPNVVHACSSPFMFFLL